MATLVPAKRKVVTLPPGSASRWFKVLGHELNHVGFGMGTITMEVVIASFKDSIDERSLHSVRLPDAMDVDRCVTLHNKILEIGWSGSGRSKEEFEEICKPWFDFHGDESEAVRDVLSSDLTAFLERAYQPGNTHTFSYYVSGLNYPNGLFEDAEIFNESWSEDGKYRFAVLYFMNTFASHPVGLVFDQSNSSAIICECVYDCSIVRNGRMTWYPLETVLEAWLSMIEKGKFMLTMEGAGEKKPWKLIPYSEQILQETVDTFNHLVDEIESRLTQDAMRLGEALPPLTGDEILDAFDPRRGFAFQFARRAKVPRFRFIAPGLAVPNVGTIAEQPFLSLASSEYVEAFPILLFGAMHGATKCTAPAPEDEDEPSFYPPFDQIKSVPAGLYLSCDMPSDNNAFEDECKLVLPFRIGARGYARTSDGARFGENTGDATEVIARDTFADLYQPGYNPFVKGHPRQLVDVLKSWLGMIRGGHWKVNADGVMGGIEEWRKADTEDSWDKYVIPVTW